MHFGVHEMQLEGLWGNGAFFLKCNYRGNRGRAWENSEELQRSAWGSVASCAAAELWRAFVQRLWKLLESCRLRMELKANARTCNVPTSDFKGLHYFLAGVNLWLLTELKWPQIGLLEGGWGHKTYLHHTYTLHLTNLRPFKYCPGDRGCQKRNPLTFGGPFFSSLTIINNSRRWDFFSAR